MSTVYFILSLILLGTASWTFLTFMDRIDEHGLIRGNLKTPLAYISGILSAWASIYAIELLPKLAIVIFALCVYWITKNKLEYPSHVSFVFLMGIYFGWKIGFLKEYIPQILLSLLLMYTLGGLFKKIIKKSSRFGQIFYSLYLSKITGDVIMSAVLLQPLMLAFLIPYAYSCLAVKLYFPWTK